MNGLEMFKYGNFLSPIISQEHNQLLLLWDTKSPEHSSEKVILLRPISDLRRVANKNSRKSIPSGVLSVQCRFRRCSGNPHLLKLPLRPT